MYDEMTKELKIFQKIINFDYIVKVKQHFFLEVEQICIQILELCSKSLDKHIEYLREENRTHSQEQALSILFFAINVLCEIHTNDIIHFDIKPQNILITNDGKYKLADFGHSKTLQYNLSYMKSIGGGTLLYSSPEQRQANEPTKPKEQIQIRNFTDIYSMGLSILEVLDIEIQSIFYDIKDDNLDKIDSIVDQKFKNIYTFIKYFMLQYDPSKRFSSIKLRQMLFDHFQNQINFKEDAERLKRSIDNYQSKDSKQQNKKYLSYLYYFQSQVLESESAEQSILKSLSMLEQLELKGKIEESIFLQQHGIILQKQCRYQESEQKLIRSHEILINYYENKNNIDIGFSCFKLFQFYLETQQFQKCLDFSKKGLEIFESNFKDKHPFTSNFLNALGISYGRLNQIEKMQEYYEKAYAMRKQLYHGDHPQIYASLNNMGVCYEKQKNYQEALKNYKAAEHMGKQLFKENDLSLATTARNIGIIYGFLDDKIQELEYYQKALKMFEQNGHSHPNFTALLNDLGCYYCKQGDYQKSLEYHLKALEMSEAQFKSNHLITAQYLQNVGYSYLRLGESQRGNEYLLKAKKMSIQLTNN
ncbi:hypothetical protein ABPG74_018103 [Tetrahymena malaccensis]